MAGMGKGKMVLGNLSCSSVDPPQKGTYTTFTGLGEARLETVTLRKASATTVCSIA